MSVMLDFLGSAMIASLLILMMITFQYQLRDQAQRTLYTATMVDHMDKACTKINAVLSLAGIGVPADSACVTATTSRMVMRTYWDYQSDLLSASRHSVEIKIVDLGSPFGKALTIVQDGTPLYDSGYIFYINEISFKYYNKSDLVTTVPSAVRSAEIFLTFRREAPNSGGRALITKIQLKCFLMNTYMRGA